MKYSGMKDSGWQEGEAVSETSEEAKEKKLFSIREGDKETTHHFSAKRLKS